MSNIIKANHLVLVRAEDYDHSSSPDEKLYADNMVTFYEEAKIMVQELITEAKAKAERILGDAQAEAEKISIDAQMEADKIKKKAYADGFLKGKEVGLSEVEKLKGQANEIINQAYTEREKILGQMEREIVDFTVQIAEKIIRSQIADKPKVAVTIVQDLLALVQDSTQVTVKVGTCDYEYIENQKGNLQTVLNYGVLNVEQDPTLKQGDCIVVSETGIVVAKIDKQLEKLHDILREVAHSD